MYAVCMLDVWFWQPCQLMHEGALLGNMAAASGRCHSSAAAGSTYLLTSVLQSFYLAAL